MIDPFLLQNKEIIERAYEHINLMTNINNQNNNKLFIYSILFLSLISFYILNKEKIEIFIKKKKITNQQNIEKKEVVKKLSTDDNNNDINEDELSDFEY